MKTNPMNPIRPKTKTTNSLRELILSPVSEYPLFLDYLTAGASLTAAAAAIGRSPEVVRQWLFRARNGGRGIYARFLTDVERAIGRARVVAEAQVKERMPLTWLERGPGRELGDEWTGTPTTVAQERPELSAPNSDLAAALIELHNAGLIELAPPVKG